jgi:hypothetical protein
LDPNQPRNWDVTQVLIKVIDEFSENAIRIGFYTRFRCMLRAAMNNIFETEYPLLHGMIKPISVFGDIENKNLNNLKVQMGFDSDNDQTLNAALSFVIGII